MKYFILLSLLSFGSSLMADTSSELVAPKSDLILRHARASQPVLRSDGLYTVPIKVSITNGGKSVISPFKVGVVHQIAGVNQDEDDIWFLPREVKVLGLKKNETLTVKLKLVTRQSWIEFGIDALVKVDSCYFKSPESNVCRILETNEDNNLRIIRDIQL